MWKRFIRAMEYRSYCMAIRELRGRGYYQKADEISEFKKNNVREFLMWPYTDEEAEFLSGKPATK